MDVGITMLRSLENVLGYQIAATDGAMGTVADFLLVDDAWAVRYLVVDTGGWLNQRRVLLSTGVVQDIADSKSEVHVGLTRELVYSSPDVDSDKSVTRQKEMLLAKHYGWKPYWITDPFLGVNVPSDRMEIQAELENSNPHLRSLREITSYTVEGNGPTGFLTDVIANDLDWSVTGLAVSQYRTRPGNLRLAPPQHVSDIDWTNRVMRIPREPGEPPWPSFDPAVPVNPRRVVRYFDYLGRLHHVTMLPETAERG
jgi:hypothetical protein